MQYISSICWRSLCRLLQRLRVPHATAIVGSRLRRTCRASCYSQLRRATLPQVPLFSSRLVGFTGSPISLCAAASSPDAHRATLPKCSRTYQRPTLRKRKLARTGLLEVERAYSYRAEPELTPSSLSRARACKIIDLNLLQVHLKQAFN